MSKKLKTTQDLASLLIVLDTRIKDMDDELASVNRGMTQVLGELREIGTQPLTNIRLHQNLIEQKLDELCRNIGELTRIVRESDKSQ